MLSYAVMEDQSCGKAIVWFEGKVIILTIIAVFILHEAECGACFEANHGLGLGDGSGGEEDDQ